MIDTDKYEGHSPAPWLRDSNDVHTKDGLRSIADVVILGDGDKLYRECVANARLIADAPLFLDFIVWVKNTHPHYYHKLTKAYQGAKSAKNNR